MIFVFYDREYNAHFGFNSSFENPTRIADSVEMAMSPDSNNIKIPSSYINIINNLEKMYDDIKTRNCCMCTFENNSDECVICGSEVGNIKLVSKIDGDTTYMCPSSTKTVTSLLKTMLWVIDWQCKNKIDTFILSRPPGHHCDNENVTGFCLINNVAILADYILKTKKRVAIVDWDVHHGNGTQKIFYERDDVLFIDIHRNNFYPYTGDVKEIGEKQGIGYTINIPLDKGSTEDVYLQTFDNIVIPSLEEYNPEWILVSCGFDAHKDDPLGGMNLHSSSYRKFYDKIKTLGLPITLLLEGGYNSKVIKESIESIVSDNVETN